MAPKQEVVERQENVTKLVLEGLSSGEIATGH